MKHSFFYLYVSHLVYFTFNSVFFVVALVQCFLKNLIFPKYGWFTVNTILFVIDIAMTTTILLSNKRNEKRKKSFRIESYYENYILCSMFQTFLCYIIIASVSFVNLETIQNSIIIQTDSQRYIEYLTITPTLIMPNIAIYFIFLSKLYNEIEYTT